MKICFVQFFCVFLPPLLISSASIRSIPFLSFIEPNFAWNVPLVSLIFFKRSLVFPFQRRQWDPTPVLLLGKSHGRTSLVGCSPWGREELERLRDFTFTFHFHALEKDMATHSSVLAWRIPDMAEPGGLLSMGSHRVGHDWSNLAAAAGISSRKLEIPREHFMQSWAR